MNFTFKQISAAIIVLVIAIVSFTTFTVVDAKHIVVAQSVRNGNLTVITEPGPTLIWWAHTTTYPRRAQYSFNKGCKTEDPGAIPPKIVQFNDGGTAILCGAISWEMPQDPLSVIRLHKEFNSEQAIDRQLIDKAIDTAIQVSGPTMSSTESVAERKAELLRIIDDQVRNGTFETIVETHKVKDTATGQEKIVNVTKIVRDEKGLPKRISGSAIVQYGIILLPLSIASVGYDDVVKGQIVKRLEAATLGQLAQTKSITAEQNAITAEQEGKADAAKAKWAQEVIKATEVTKAQQHLEVARLAAQEAELFKREQILRGEGEAARKQLVMNADGALDQKLQAYIEVNKIWAEAIQGYQGNWVPSVIMGNSNGQPGGGATALVDMLTIKTAKELGMDMSVKGTSKTNK